MSGTYLAALDGKARKLLLKGWVSAVYAPASHEGKGHLLYLREGGALMAQPLDPGTYDLAGEAVPVADQVGTYLTYGFFSASANGVLAYRSGLGVATNTELVWFDRAGKPLGPLGPPGVYNDLALSIDGQRVAVNGRDPRSGNSDLWLLAWRAVCPRNSPSISHLIGIRSGLRTPAGCCSPRIGKALTTFIRRTRVAP